MVKNEKLNSLVTKCGGALPSFLLAHKEPKYLVKASLIPLPRIEVTSSNVYVFSRLIIIIM